MPRSVLITTATLTLIAGLAGFWLGQRQVTLDASGVIEAVAERHGSGDCVGFPGEGDAVFVVRCDAVTYAVDRLGRITLVEEGGI